MYDDYDLDYTSGNDYGQDLEEYIQELDEEYTRDAHDLEALAYRHYAWYHNIARELWSQHTSARLLLH